MDAAKILRVSAQVYNDLPENATDNEYEDAMRKAMPGMYEFADEFDKMTPEEQAEILASPLYGGTG